MSTIPPTIGRKIWLWISTDPGVGCVLEAKQAFDASICFVHPDGTINVTFADHEGNHGVAKNVPVYDSKETDTHMGGGSAYCTWMPYQTGQAKKHAAQAA